MASELGRRPVLAALAGAAAAWPAAARAADPSDGVATMLSERIGADSVGYVAAVADAAGARISAAGQADPAGGRALDGDTVFEIGSITKVFTALLLADMAQRGEVALTDPVAKYLPAEGQPRLYDGKPIALLDLATYTSGLPGMPNNFAPKNPANPHADYTVAQLYEVLSNTPLQSFPGSRYEYSNLGFGLLGHALALRAGRSYEDLVVSRICAPLGMDDTRIILTAGMQQRLAPGHDRDMQRVANWDVPTLAGAGALRSTANDLVRLLQLCRGRGPPPLSRAMDSLIDVRRATDQPDEVAAEGWFVRTRNIDEIVWKNGGTGGYATFIGYSTHTGRGAVLLGNTANDPVTSRLGFHLVNARFPVPPVHRQVQVEPSALAALAGRYALTPRFALTVAPRDNHLGVQATNQLEFEAFPESATQFFFRVLDAQLTFELGSDGLASAVVLHQNGQDRRGERVK